MSARCRTLAIWVVGLAACSSGAAPAAQRNTVPPAALAKPEVTAPFERDTTQATARGTATFVVPAGWSLVKEPELTRVRAPEGDEVFAIVDLAEPNGAAAIAAAWKLVGRIPQWTVEQTAELPARDGWLGGVALEYEVPPSLKQTLRAFALYGTARTIVVLLETDTASFESACLRCRCLRIRCARAAISASASRAAARIRSMRRGSAS